MDHWKEQNFNSLYNGIQKTLMNCVLFGIAQCFVQRSLLVIIFTIQIIQCCAFG